MHADIDTLERIEIMRDLRLGEFDILVGINLLREGLDVPECMLMAILDADKEGYLRSKTSLIQTIGRAARNVDGRVILYADNMTKSMQGAIEETDRRRARQVAYNEAHGITPETVKKAISDQTYFARDGEDSKASAKAARRGPYGLHDNEQELLLNPDALHKHIAALEKQMHEAAANLEFEAAAEIRDQIRKLENAELGL